MPRVLALVAVALLVVGWGAMAGAQERAGRDDGRDEVVRGGELFQAQCATCHGTRLEGGHGEGDLDGPPMTDLDIAYVDLTMRTGRMPVLAPEVGVRIDQLDDEQREAINAYLLATFDLPGEIPTVGAGEAARGQELYVRNCAACHGAAGDGGIAGGDNAVPPLAGLDPIALVEGTRIGPFTMPAFDESVLDVQQLDDIVAYLALADAAPRSAVGVRELDQVGEALFAIGLALLAAVVLWVVSRARRWSPAEPGSFARSEPFEPR
ncbi:MAG: c-type cytochrome [Nitriliruptor sp.]|uniref:cytochrome c n=1 Tax=Nitriliruptor sp. TaxID=2448056 RepID=UPI00349FFE0E